jgi:regulator of chromosome condensation
MALTVSGDVYGWGCYKDKEGRKWFDAIPGTKVWILIYNCAFDMYWGWNEREKKGKKRRERKEKSISYACLPTTTQSFQDGSIKRQQDSPMKITTLPPSFVTDIKCGASFNAVLLKDGSVLTWGLGEVGDMGRPAPPLRDADGNYQMHDIAQVHLAPASPQLKNGGKLPFIKTIGTGMWHLFLVTATGSDVYTSGLNNYGQLGLGDETNRNQLEIIPGLEGCQITEIGGGQHHSMAISSTQNLLLTWGRSDYGQLGYGEKGEVKPGSFTNVPAEAKIPRNETPTQMSCGENHNLILTDKHNVRRGRVWGCFLLFFFFVPSIYNITSSFFFCNYGKLAFQLYFSNTT